MKIVEEKKSNIKVLQHCNTSHEISGLLAKLETIEAQLCSKKSIDIAPAINAVL